MRSLGRAAPLCGTRPFQPSMPRTEGTCRDSRRDGNQFQVPICKQYLQVGAEVGGLSLARYRRRWKPANHWKIPNSSGPSLPPQSPCYSSQANGSPLPMSAVGLAFPHIPLTSQHQRPTSRVRPQQRAAWSGVFHLRHMPLSQPSDKVARPVAG